MKILGETLSDEASRIVESIIKNSKRKIEFEELESPKCMVDIEKDPNKYLVFINHEYAKNDFDFCVLHELMHTVQMDKGYPRLYYDTDNTSDSKEFLIGKIDSLVKDIFVNRALLEYGFKIKMSPVCNFRNRYIALKNKGRRNAEDKTMMVICLVALKYAYMQDVQDLLVNIDSYGIAGEYRRIDKVIKDNSEDCCESLKNIYEQFAKEFKCLNIVYVE